MAWISYMPWLYYLSHELIFIISFDIVTSKHYQTATTYILFMVIIPYAIYTAVLQYHTLTSLQSNDDLSTMSAFADTTIVIYATHKPYITLLFFSHLQISRKCRAACKTATVPSAPNQNCLLPVPCTFISLLLHYHINTFSPLAKLFPLACSGTHALTYLFLVFYSYLYLL